MLETARRFRRSMLSTLSPESLGTALDQFDQGTLEPAARMWEIMAERDDVLKNVKPKREKALGRRKWNITQEDNSEAAQQHADVLTRFWDNITAVNLFDRNETGGLSRLVRQMLSCVSYRYAVHHLEWSTDAAGNLTCTFEHVPLYFFENTTGRLRFLESGRGLKGRDLEPGEWMVCTGDGLMVAASIGYLCKRNGLADWMAFSEKFGVPGVLGKTPHAKGSEGGNAMLEAVEAFTSDWAAVIYGDESGGGKVELVETKAGSIPMPMLIERVDRRMAALYRGADLSSISSTSGQGTGASLQEKEAVILEMDDAIMVQEKLWEIEKKVIAWHFGEGVAPLAYIEFVIPEPEDLKLKLDAIEKLVRMGAPVAVETALGMFGLPMPDATSELLEAADKYVSAYTRQEEQGGPVPGTEINAKGSSLATDEQFQNSCVAALRLAAARDRAPIAAALRRVLATEDADFSAALSSFQQELPEAVRNDAHQVKAWQRILSTAWLRGLAAAEAEENDTLKDEENDA
jgi:phage gp29-like protein